MTHSLFLLKPSLMSNHRWLIRSLIIGLSVLMSCDLVCLAEAVSIDGDSPTIVYVSSAKAEVRSGPSADHYPTHRLALGATLEAHHRSQDGWLAVRPPSGSFSWLPAAKAYLLPGGKVIEVTDVEAVSWIGTQLGTAKHYRWQVKLNVGEQLKVLGEKSMTDADGHDELWYKIAPPDGEYRWIHEHDVSLEPVEAMLVEPEPDRIAEGNNVRALGQKRAVSASSATASAMEPATLAVAGDASGYGRANQSVETANYQDDVFGDGPVNGLQPVPQMLATRQTTPSTNRWDGWNAWDVDDDGMRLTFLEKLMGGRSSAPLADPQAADPFDLRMASQVPSNGMSPAEFQVIQEQQLASSAMGRVGMGRAGMPTAALAQDRPWRDPRALRQERLARTSTEASLSRMPPDIIRSIRKNVQSLRESIGSTARATRDKVSGAEPEFADEWGEVDDLDVPPIRPFDGVPSSGGRTAERPDPLPTDESVPATQWYGIGSQRADWDALGPVSNDFAPPARPSPAPATQAARSAEIDQLKVAVSEMVAGPPSSWNLERLAERTTHLIEHGADPIERGQARLLLERIQEFETHAERTAFAAPGVIRSSYSGPSRPVNRSDAPRVITAGYERPSSSSSEVDSWRSSGANPGISQPYDATGWLVPVHATTSGQPSHAITDDSGHIVAYVTSRSGLDLDSYVNQPVGIIGLRGYLPHLQSSHIQAQRIIALR